LFIAVDQKHVDVTAMLIAAGADVNAVVTWVLPRALPHFAKAFDGSVLTQSHLCNRAEEDTVTTIYAALMNGDIEIFRLLIAAGADVNYIATWVLPRALPHFAKAFDGSVLMQSHLCNRVGGATITPIIFALVAKCDIEIFRLLISAGADVNYIATWVLPRAPIRISQCQWLTLGDCLGFPKMMMQFLKRWALLSLPWCSLRMRV
jgi:hypothetical protein